MSIDQIKKLELEKLKLFGSALKIMPNSIKQLKIRNDIIEIDKKINSLKSKNMAIDQTAIQRLKNEISDGELTLRTGKFNKRKLSKTELDALSIYVTKKKNKLRDITKNAASKTTRKATATKRSKRKPTSETGVLKYSKALGNGKYEYKYVKKRK